jgi:hypothetical protein
MMMHMMHHAMTPIPIHGRTDTGEYVGMCMTMTSLMFLCGCLSMLGMHTSLWLESMVRGNRGKCFVDEENKITAVWIHTYDPRLMNLQVRLTLATSCPVGFQQISFSVMHVCEFCTLCTINIESMRA